MEDEEDCAGSEHFTWPFHPNNSYLTEQRTDMVAMPDAKYLSSSYTFKDREMTTDGFMDIPDPKSVDLNNVPIVK